MNIFETIKQANLIEEVESAIYEWHEECEAGCDGECEIYDAIQNNVNIEELIAIAYDIDADLFDRFNIDLTQVSN